MRTTIDLDDEVFRELKALAALKGVSMKEIILKAVQDELANANRADVVRDRVQYPILESKEPGALHLTNAEIDDLLT